MEQEEQTKQEFKTDHEPCYNARGKDTVDAKVEESPLEAVKGIGSLRSFYKKIFENGNGQPVACCLRRLMRIRKEQGIYFYSRLGICRIKKSGRQCQQ